MTTKRILSLLSAVCLVVALAAGCAGNGNGVSSSWSSAPSAARGSLFFEGLRESKFPVDRSRDLWYCDTR